MTRKHTSSKELIVWLWRDYLRHYMGLLGLAVFFMLIEAALLVRSAI